MPNVFRSVIPLLTAAGVFSPFMYGQTGNRMARSEISQLGNQYVSLVRILYGHSPYPKLIHIGDEQADKVAKGSFDILHQGILLLLNSYGNDASEIRKGIDDIQGEYAVPPDAADSTNAPFVDPFVIDNDDGAAVGFLGGDSPYGQLPWNLAGCGKR